MGNWAVVVGINEYDKMPELRLQGSIRDAMRMCHWLLDPAGGNVPRHNLYALLGPIPPADQLRIRITNPSIDKVIVDHTPTVFDPTKSNLVSAIADLDKRCRADASCDRFFFYFSGHGVTAVEQLTVEESGILLCDFSTDNPDISLSIDELKNYFAAMPFADQFFFIDACRDLPLDPRFRLGRFPRYPNRNANGPTVQQFFMFATSPGRKAAQIGGTPDGSPSGDERGALTTTLLDGLAGKGAAKRYAEAESDDSAQFIVRWSTLFGYVQRSVSQLNLPFAQAPQEDGPRGGCDRPTDPLLGIHQLDRFQEEPLSVTLLPPLAAGVSTLAICLSGDSIPVRSSSRPASLPVKFTLPPRPYVVVATADGFRSRKRRWPIDVYEPVDLEVQLVADASAKADDPPPPQPAPPAPPTVSRRIKKLAQSMIERALDSLLGPLSKHLAPSMTEVLSEVRDPMRGASPFQETRRATLVLRFRDPLLSFEVSDSAGRQVNATAEPPTESGVCIARMSVKAGTYVVRTRTPEGAVFEEWINLAPEDHEELTLKGPGDYTRGAIHNLTLRAGFHVDEFDRTLHVSEHVGAMGAAELSTVVTLAGALATHGHQDLGWGARLRMIGLPPLSFPDDARSGAYLVFADEAGGGRPPIPWNLVQLRLEPHAGRAVHARPVVAAGNPGVASFAAPITPGRLDLQVSAPDRPTVLFPLVALPDHLTMVVFAKRPNADVHVFLYTPHLRPRAAFDATHLRRLELVERHLLRGRYDEVGEPAHLAASSWSAPIARCLAAYLFLRQRDFTQARDAASSLLKEFPTLPDAHLIMAECSAAEDDSTQAAALIRTALDCGLPLFVGGLALLRAAVERYQLDAAVPPDYILAVQRRVPGLLWTAYNPKKHKSDIEDP